MFAEKIFEKAETLDEVLEELNWTLLPVGTRLES